MQSNTVNFEGKGNVLKNFGRKSIDTIFDGKVERQKEYLKNEMKMRREMHKTLLDKYDKRIDKIKKQNVENNATRIETSRLKVRQTRKRLENIKALEESKKIKLMRLIKEKETKARKRLIERKNMLIQEKQNKDKKHYSNKFECQNIALEKMKRLIEKCSDHEASDGYFNDNAEESFDENNETVVDEPLEEISEEEKCTLDLDRSVKNN